MKITKQQLKQIIKEEIHKVLSEAPNREFVGPVDELPDAPIGGDVPGASEHQYDWMREALPESYNVAIKLETGQAPSNEELFAARGEMEIGDYSGAALAQDLPSAGAYSAATDEDTVRQYQEEYADLDSVYNLYNIVMKALPHNLRMKPLYRGYRRKGGGY